MRLKIEHVSRYSYRQPPSTVTQILRLTPRSHQGQFVVDWRVEVDQDCRLRAAADAFGNLVHSFDLAGPIDSMTITATGEVETENTNGIVSGQLERFPPTIFLRETDLTRSGVAIRNFADDAAATAEEPLDKLHALNKAIFERMRFELEGTEVTTTAVDAFAAGHGVCQDYAHIFVAAARHLGVPSRYVGGYLYRPDQIDQVAGHGWAEALVEGLGWVAFDPTNGISMTDSYVRVAVGLDYLGASPIRGTHYGGSHEELNVTVRVEEVGLQYQSQ